MTARRTGWMALGFASLLVACRPPPSRVSERLSWQSAEKLTDVADGSELEVSPGEVVRFESTTPLRVGEVLRSSDGEAVIWRSFKPDSGVILVRPDLGTSAIRAPRASLQHAHVGVAQDPAYGWFALEDQALSWAEGPLGTPFPALAPAQRLSPDLAALDDVLRETPDAPTTAVTAIRSIVALRTVRELQGLRRYPYTRNEPLELKGGGPVRVIEDIDYASIADGKPVPITIDGPSDLFVMARAQRGTRDSVFAVTIEENGRKRGGYQATLAKIAAASTDVGAASLVAEPNRGLGERTPPHTVETTPPDIAILPPLHLSVPPGRHRYQLTPKGAALYAYATESRAAVHLGEALSSTKDEQALSERATQACSSERAAPACLLALALAGEDASPGFTKALRSSPEKAQSLATRIASGVPLDRAASLESSAYSAPGPAADALGRAARETIDPALRAAWSRATSRETTWQTVTQERERMWFASLPLGELPPTCKDAKPTPVPPEQELRANTPLRVPSSPWRRARTLRLLVVAPCGGEPIRIEVDGQVLTAQPKADRVMWNIVVRGETSTIERLDGGPGRVSVLADDPCATHGTFLRAPDPIQGSRSVTFPPATRSPGLEVWLREGVGSRSIEVSAKDGSTITVVAKPQAGALSAIDEEAGRWLRAPRIPLPQWAAGGITIKGQADVAVRPVVRAPRAPEAEKVYAKPADVAAVVAVSKKLIDAKDDTDRSAAHLERALLLASYGHPAAADEDAIAAKALGAHGPAGEDPVPFVAAAVLPELPKPLEVVNAYGLEPDFDPGAARCKAASEGSRAEIGAMDIEARKRPPDAPLDRPFASRVIDAVLRAPMDPRAESVLLLAMPSSKWQLLRDNPPPGSPQDPSTKAGKPPTRVDAGPGGRVPRPHDSTRDPLIDADGRLRARIIAGDPFGGRFVSVTHDHPAKAFVADLGSAKGRIDYVCVPRHPSDKVTRCPLALRVGDGPTVAVAVPPNGRGTAPFPPTRGRGKNAGINIDVGESEGDWLALVRIVFDGKVLGATEVSGVGWVLDTPHFQYRFLATPTQAVHVRVKSPTILRIDAIPEPSEQPTVVCNVEGREVSIPIDGRPVVIATSGPTDVTIESRGAKATVAIAERIDGPARLSAAAIVQARNAEKGEVTGDITAAHVEVDGGAWRDRVPSSESPPSGFVDALGTLGVASGVVAQSLREGVRINSAPDTFLFENLSYRRAIESVGLYTMLGGSLHLREVASSYGGHVGLFENLEAARLRVGAFADAFTQDVESKNEGTVRPRAFVEYTWRTTPSVFILPRIGYDGFYTTIHKKPASVRNIDDAVYNAFRDRRPTLLYLQSLVRYAPHFNDSLYAKARANFDAVNAQLSHATLRGGYTLVVGLTELELAGDAQYFVRTPVARPRSSIDALVNAAVTQSIPLVPRSVNMQGGAQGGYRISDGSYQVLAVISFTASAGRGVRDFSVYEHVFHEQIPGGTPWSAGAEGLSP